MLLNSPEETSGFSFDNKHYINLLFSLWDAIGNNGRNIFLTRKDLLSHPRYNFNSKALDQLLKREIDAQPNKLIDVFNFSNPNTVRSYSLSANGLSFVFMIKASIIYADNCDTQDQLSYELKKLRQEYEYKFIYRAKVIHDNSARKINITLSEVGLNKKELNSIETQYNSEGCYRGLYIRGEDKYLVDESRTLHPIDENEKDAHTLSANETCNPRKRNIDKSDILVDYDEIHKILYINAEYKDTTLSYEQMKTYKDSDIEKVVLSANIGKIGSSTFSCWPISQVEFTSNLKSIGRHCFEGCYKLEYVGSYRSDYSAHGKDYIDTTNPLSVHTGIYAFNNTPSVIHLNFTDMPEDRTTNVHFTQDSNNSRKGKNKIIIDTSKS
ncbi:leucine-rich repeat protein [Methanomethylophilus alvi]|uniref:leucine-rich repeat protein n=1 Tax=Methanomethylophilus alvi TaxID=1291540 RepID=UPI0037DD6D53